MNTYEMEKEEGDDSGDESLGAFERGHWVWDDDNGRLTFLSDLPQNDDGLLIFSLKPDIAKVEFNDDIDLFEQQRFKKRYQRKGPQVDDVIFLQDIVDLVIFTAPIEILSTSIIKILHLPVTETFLRALIFYCQYYLQVDSEMKRRIEETEFRIPTTFSYITENGLMDDLADLRLLVAKEYSSIILGEGQMRHFHHMGPKQTGASLSHKDIDIHEILAKMSIQIVWIALGRQSYNIIEMEVHRLFKSEIYNSAEHKLKTNYIAEMTPRQRQVLFGGTSTRRPKYNIQSPLLDELLSQEHTNYQKFGLGKIKYPATGPSRLSERLLYMEQALVAPEPQFQELNVSVGILGLPRARFDIMLRVIKSTANRGSTPSVSRSRTSQISRSLSVTKSISSKMQQRTLYKSIVLPPKSLHEVISLPETFPQKKLPHSQKAWFHEQRQKWLSRHARLTNKARQRRA